MFYAQPQDTPSWALSWGNMGTFKSPDRPASFLHRLVRIEDTEPPITDQEYDLYQRFVDSIGYAPPDIVEKASYPKAVNRRTRAAVRRFVSDPGLPGMIETLERAKAKAIADEQRREQEKQAEEARAERQRLQEKLAAIEAFHDNQLNELRFEVGQFQHLIGQTSIEEATLRIAQESQSDWTKNVRALNVKVASGGDARGAILGGALAGLENNLRDKSSARGVAAGMARFTIRRTLVSMTEGERATLRMADVLAAIGRLTPDDHLRIAVPIVWNGGECAYDFGQQSEFRERTAMLEVFKQLMAASLGTSAGARERLNQAVRAALDEASGLPSDQRQIVERYLFSGNRWMSEAEGQRALARDDLSASALRIGGFPGGSSDLLYDMDVSLITIAPSGSGKSQAHVLRNLLHMKAPAVVLDIKGEMSTASRQWREDEVGKTYVFSPREPDSSFHYNPLDDIGTDPEQAWEDARTVADLMFKPAAKTRDDAYFEGRARDLLTTALLDVALAQKGDKRTMTSVLQLLYTSDDEEVLAWCKRLEKRKSTQLTLQASALRGMPVKQRESLLDTARRHIEIWQSPSVLKVTGDTTFDAASLRSENATVYLKVTLEDVERYASVLRVLVGQLLLKLYRVTPESDSQIVTFFLDELPRLGRLDVIEQSLDMGRSYGVRLWLFCQNMGQLQTAYPNASGMLSNCAIRCFMNPDEDAARWLSENLSTRHGLLDGTRKPLVEAHQLTGPEFANQVVVFSRGQLPARLDKKPAFADQTCRERIAGVKAPVGERDTPAEAEQPVATEAPTETQQEAVHDGSVNWDELRKTAPPAVSSQSEPAARADSGKWPLAIAGLAAIALVGSLAWVGNLASELRAVRAEKASAVEAAEGARQSFTRDKATWTGTLRGVEQEREKFRSESDSARKVLTLEQKDHVAPRERLAGVQRDLDAQKARVAALDPALAEQKDRSARAIAAAEQQSATLRNGLESAYAELKKEQNAHAATRERLAGVQRDLDAQKVRVAAIDPTLAEQRDRNARAIATVEQQSATLRNELDSARAELKGEQNAHAAARDRLVSLQKQIDAERITRAAPPPSAPTPPQPAPQQQTVLPPAASPPSVQPTPAPQASASPQGSKTIWSDVMLPRAAPSQAIGVTDCDTLAANPNDQRRVSAGVKYADLKRNTSAAIEACDRALAAGPREQRFLYQKARALYAENAKDVRARAMFDELMNAGYPSAFDNGAQYLLLERRTPEAERLLRRGVQLQDPDAMVTLADAIKNGLMPPRAPNEQITLYQMAAKLGHQGAKNTVEQMQAIRNFVDETSKRLLPSLNQ